MHLSYRHGLIAFTLIVCGAFGATSPSAESTPPIPIRQSRAAYPIDLLRDGVEGSVLVGYVVTETGDVTDVHVVRSTMEDFEAPALKAVSRWKFKPGTKNGVAVRTNCQVTIPFTLGGPGQKSPSPGAGDAIIRPVAVHQVSPVYPPDLRQQRITGEVVVAYTIDVNGVPTQVRAVRSTRPEFEAPAVAAIRKWRFKPGTRNGVPVPCNQQTPVVFSLADW